MSKSVRLVVLGVVAAATWLAVADSASAGIIFRRNKSKCDPCNTCNTCNTGCTTCSTGCGPMNVAQAAPMTGAVMPVSYSSSCCTPCKTTCGQCNACNTCNTCPTPRTRRFARTSNCNTCGTYASCNTCGQVAQVGCCGGTGYVAPAVMSTPATTLPPTVGGDTKPLPK